MRLHILLLGLLCCAVLKPVSPAPNVILKDKFDGIDDSEQPPEAEYSYSMNELFKWSVEHSDEEELRKRAEASPEDLEAQRLRIQELRKIMDDLNNLPTEFDLLQEAIDILKDPATGHELQETALLRIQDLCAPIWVAEELPKMGGLEPCLKSLESPVASIRSAASWALGTAATNNPSVQEALMEAKGVSKLVNAAKEEDDSDALTKHVFALGGLVRDSLDARKEFASEGGPGMLVQLLTGNMTTTRNRLKALTVIRDIALAEGEQEEGPAAHVLHYDQELLGGVLSLVTQSNLDLREKALEAMKVLLRSIPSSRTIFQDLHAESVLGGSSVHLVQLREEENAEGEDGDDEMSYIAELLTLLSEVTEMIIKGVDEQAKDEL